MYKTGGEELVICPYNRYHVVSKLRIQKHMVKCQKNNPDIKLATCFYNYSHRVKPGDLLSHYETCTHKTKIEGARYYEPPNFSSSTPSVDNDYHLQLPDITAKPKFFCKPSFLSSNSSVSSCEDCRKLDSSELDSDSDHSQDFCRKAHNADEDDELKPLPLPKTVSKAFVYPKQPSPRVACGRGQMLLPHSPPKPPRSSDHLLPDISDMESFISNGRKSSKLFPRSEMNSCSASIVSSMFDDKTTYKSEDIIFDDESDSEIDGKYGFLTKDFEKYTKI